MPTIYRLTLSRYADTAFTGEGARRVGGRWSPPGYAAVYCASSIALAVLETLVHTDQSALPSHQVIAITVPDTLPVTTLPQERLPANWREVPAPSYLQSLGAEWLTTGETAVFAVPSALVPQEMNFLINPVHADFKELSIDQAEPFDMDGRLLRP